jgi:S-disulfanyl-L-cysteine oxidoreductase SoxD
VTATAWKAACLAVVVVLLAGVAWGLGLLWGNVHMAVQPAVAPQQSVVRMPEGAIPRDRVEPFRRPRDLKELVVARREAGELANPVAADERSLERGLFIYETYCQVCHGADGRGDGPVGALFVPPPMDLNLAYVQNQPDGQLFYTVSYGSLIMPRFDYAIRIEDRWHVVNYLRHMGALNER